MVVGYTGDGKSTGVAVADELVLVPRRVIDFEGTQPIGSGEGIAEAYMGWETITVKDARGRPRSKTVRRQVRNRVLIYVDEGETLLRLQERTGSTSGSVLRLAYMAALIGQRNARQETTRIVHGHTYSLGLIIGIQPHLAAKILADPDAGTPQRFHGPPWTTRTRRTFSRNGPAICPGIGTC